MEARRWWWWAAAAAVMAMAVTTEMGRGVAMRWRAGGGAGPRHRQRGLTSGSRRSATALAHGEGVMGVYVWERAQRGFSLLQKAP